MSDELLKEYDSLVKLGYADSKETFLNKVRKGVKICFKSNDGFWNHLTFSKELALS